MTAEAASDNQASSPGWSCGRQYVRQKISSASDLERSHVRQLDIDYAIDEGKLRTYDE